MHCTAKSKRSGQQCRNKPVIGRTVCRMHGGNARRGIAHPNFQTGRYAKDLPASLAKELSENLESEDLTSLREDLALSDIRISELLRKLKESGEPLNSPNWEGVWQALAHRRKLVEAYDKHAVMERKYIPIEKVRNFLQQFSMIQKNTLLKYTDFDTANMLLTKMSEAGNRLLASQKRRKGQHSKGEQISQ